MAITYVDGGGAALATATTSYTVTLPAGTVEGDCFVVVVTTRDPHTVNSRPSGATVVQEGENSGSAVTYSVYLWFAPASPPASITVGLASAVAGSVVWGRFRGVDPASPLAGDYVQGNWSTVASDFYAPAFSTTADGAFVVGGLTLPSGSRTVTVPTGWTSIFTAGERIGALAYEGEQATAGPAGSAQWFISGTALRGDAWQMALRPDAGGAAPPVIGAGAASAPTPWLAGAGSLRATGAGAVATAAALAVVAGMVSLTGTGGMTAPPAAVAAAGQVAISGVGSATAGRATAAGPAALGLNGGGGVTAPGPTLSGPGAVTGAAVTGGGSATAGPPAVTGAGALTLTGVGTATAPAPIVAGPGAVGGLIAGTGTLVPPPATIAGTGALTLVGSGAASAGTPTVTGAAVVAIVGAGDLTPPGAIVVGNGSVFDPTAFRDVSLTLGPLTGHPLVVDRLTAHPLRVTDLRAHPLTAGNLTGHPMRVTGLRTHPLTVTAMEV